MLFAASKDARTQDATYPPTMARQASPPSAAGAVLARVAAGNLTAVQACMNRYGPLVWGLARRHTRSREDAEDATQEIFTEIWRNAARYDPERGSEAVFITVLARRRLIDRARARRGQLRTEPLGPEAEGATVNPSAEDASEVALAGRAVAKLGDQERRLLLMAVVDGRSHAEIASATGLALGTVKTTIRRALTKVRDHLVDQPADAAKTSGELET